MKRTLLLLLFLFVLAACGGQTETAAPDAVDVGELPATVDVETVAQIKDREDVILLDVREQWEYDEAHSPGVTLIPMNQIPASLEQIPTDETVVVTCRSGNRSGQVVDYLRQQGYENVHNMAGGILAWEEAGYDVVR